MKKEGKMEGKRFKVIGGIEHLLYEEVILVEQKEDTSIILYPRDQQTYFIDNKDLVELKYEVGQVFYVPMTLYEQDVSEDEREVYYYLDYNGSTIVVDEKDIALFLKKGELK